MELPRNETSMARPGQGEGKERKGDERYVGRF
jgi:hypothetical protein